MEDLFNLLVVDENSLSQHIGEECELYKEVPSSPTSISEYELYFRGIIRSVWNEVSQNINVICDADQIYVEMFIELKEKMFIEEQIVFTITNK